MNQQLNHKNIHKGARVALMTVCAALLTACAGLNEPKTRVVTKDSFILSAAEEGKVLEVDNIAIEDKGEVNLTQPVRIQDCNGYQLKVRRFETKDGIKEEPVYITVDPLTEFYVRRLEVRNNTTNVLRLNRADAVLVDPNGNDYELANEDIIEQRILQDYPCPSGGSVAGSVRTLLRTQKVIGSNVRIRPGRDIQFLAIFSDVKLRPSDLGDWTLELNDFPVQTDDKGDVSKVAQFKFDLVAKGVRTTITQEKANFLAPWVETDRTTRELGVN